ncbi:MAG: suppressor of fused domain protein [Candidatus Obscuribacterales bacterium]|nr:suppressor of fused domain protein [Candidatus Obscuribacterales bacterium]
MTEDANNLLRRAWHDRDRLYHELFGPHKYTLPKLYEAPLDAETRELTSVAEIAAISGKSLSEKDIHIVAYEPNEIHPYWIFASSGLSNPWFGQSEDVSGFGCELVLKTKTPGRWVLKLMRRLLYYILSYSGTLSPGVMLGIDAPLFSEGKGEIGAILVWYLDEAPDTIYELASGRFGIFSVIGITGDEAQFVEQVDQYGCWCMQQILQDAGYLQCTEPQRESLMKQEEIAARIKSMKNYLANFGFSPG